MHNLKKLIEKNLYLRVDFDNRYKKAEKGITEDTKFFLIGVLPVMIFYQNAEREKASLNYPLLVAKDPFLRLLQGAKATDYQRLGSYRKKVKEIVRGIEGGFLKVLKDSQFNNKEFEKILIINFDQKNAGNTNDKNGGDQTLRQECQETSNQAD